MNKPSGAPRALPARPNLDHLKNQARALHASARAGDAAALERFTVHHPKLGRGVEPDVLTLSDAQLVLAREHGFRSWPKLRSHVLRVGDATDGAARAGADAAHAAIRERLRRLGRIDGRVSARDLRRIERPLEPRALLELAVQYVDAEARPALLGTDDPAAVVAALDAVIGSRRPEPVGAGRRDDGADDAAEACLAVLYCGGFPHLLGRRFGLGGDRVTLGRNLERDVAFNDDSVSRLHCTIERRDGRFVLRDERSTNGTFVASGTFVNQVPEPVTEHVLADGDQFAIGDVILAFLAPPPRPGEDPAERRARLEARYDEAIEYIARHDALTRLFNRRAFEAELSRAVLRARGADRPLSAVLIDVDDFKRCNDRLGLLAGNGLLLRVAQVLRQQLDDTAIVGRYAGDQYGVLLPGVDLQGAVEAAERLRAAVESRPLELGGERIHATVSAGIATLYRTTGGHELLEDAASALREAKQAGRNTVRAAA